MTKRVLWQGCIVAAVGYFAGGLALAQSTVDCSTIAEDMARLKCYDEQARQKKMGAPPAAPASTAPATASTAGAQNAPATPAPSAAATPPHAPVAVPSAAPPAAAAAAPAVASAAAPASATASAAAAPSAPATARSSSNFGLNAEAIRRREAATNPNALKEPEQLVARVSAVTTKPRGEYRITLEDGQVWEETQHSSTSTPPEVGDTVTIKRGVLGSYFLSHSVGLALRVKRID